MSLPLRPRMSPRCTACLRGYMLAALRDEPALTTALRQQVRGRKKASNNSGIVTVRLLKDVKTFGRRGALVPIARGQMRNAWFPGRVAEYVTTPELKTLRLSNVAMERNFTFGTESAAKPADADPSSALRKDIPSDTNPMSNEEIRSASAFEKARPLEVEKLTPERSTELVEIFVPQRLDFYRPPIVEEKEPEPSAPELKKQPQLGGAAGELMAARQRKPEKPKEKPQAIYGSVTLQDVLMSMRAAMAENDEARRVVLHEQDLRFVDLPELEGAEAGRLKHVGEFKIEVKVRGGETAVRRTVKVNPQDA